jgi:hypothetical protein
MREAFEKWYKKEYWNFEYKGLTQANYEKDTDSYDHSDVDLAYQSFKAGFLYCVITNEN